MVSRREAERAAALLAQRSRRFEALWHDVRRTTEWAVPRNGNCFFEVVASLRLMTGLSVQDIRHALAAHLERGGADERLVQCVRTMESYDNPNMLSAVASALPKVYPQLEGIGWAVVLTTASGMTEVVPLGTTQPTDARWVVWLSQTTPNHVDVYVVDWDGLFDHDRLSDLRRRAEVGASVLAATAHDAEVARELLAADQDAQRHRDAADERATLAFLAREGMGSPTTPPGWATFGDSSPIVSPSGGGGDDLRFATQLQRELDAIARDAAVAAEVAAADFSEHQRLKEDHMRLREQNPDAVRDALRLEREGEETGEYY